MKPKPSFSWEQIDALHPALIDARVPANAFTALQYADRYGISTHRAHARLEDLVRTGKLATGKCHNGSANRLKSFFWVP